MNRVIQKAREDGRETLLEPEAKQLLAEFDVSVPEFQVAHSRDEAVSAAREIGYPVVMKIVSPDVTHKSDANGVLLNLESDEMAADAYEDILENVTAYDSDATIEGVLVEEMIDGLREMIVGVTKTRNFGPAVMIGMGGVTVELFSDVAFRLPPLDREEVMETVESLQTYPLLSGYRGDPPADVSALVESILNLGGADGLIAELGKEISEMDLNPVIVRPNEEGCVVSDALVTLT